MLSFGDEKWLNAGEYREFVLIVASYNCSLIEEGLREEVGLLWFDFNDSVLDKTWATMKKTHLI